MLGEPSLLLVFELRVFSDPANSLALELLVSPKQSCKILDQHKQASSENVAVKVVWNPCPYECKVAQEATMVINGDWVISN